VTTQLFNSLSRASSAYLRSAMHQPIHWHEWGEEAFAKARAENKPVLLDIGAVWCHWCHVMDRESYDDPAIAEIVNQHFIAVKVDRDERPDIDSRYQLAVSAVSGQGGWPLTAFLTPDGKPFYGGTYFPPQDHYGRPSFQRVLLSISNAYREKNSDVTEQARLVEAAIAQSESPAGKGNVSLQIVDGIVQSALKMFDETHGGFGHAPKFFHPGVIDLLLDRYVRTGEEELLNLVTFTLTKMAAGGVYDQLAGGFHRYSVDERWIVPHFEKMSYDNSELLKNYVHAYQVTGDEAFAAVAKDILRWMDEWLSDRKRGGFYASQDADYSLDDDGDYFTWTLEETRAALTEDEANVTALHYQIDDIGEMHHNPAKNVLHLRASVDEIAKRLSLPAERVRELLASAKQKMYAARLKRPTPYVDKTVYTNWNAMCVSACLEASRVLNLPEVGRFALHSLDRVLSQGWHSTTGLHHVIAYSDPQAEHRQVAAGLDDYADLAVACLDAYEFTSDLSYYRFARQIVDAMIETFFDSENGGFFDTAQGDNAASLGVLGTRRKPFQDSPTPAGNSVAAIALLRLHSLTADNAYRDQAEATLELIADVAGQYGIFAATYGIAVTQLVSPHTQAIILGEDQLANQLYRRAAKPFFVGKSVLKLAFNQAVLANLPSALGETIAALPAVRERKTAAVICSNFTCLPATSDPAILEEILKNSARTR
jgi:uncharacterized protein YyaL (SSP411 family)